MVKHLSLNGKWHLSDSGETFRYFGSVPGCVHTDLQAAGVLPDLWLRDNERHHAWVWEKDWVYERTFNVSEEDLRAPFQILRCHGLDTLAEIFLNGKSVLTTDNMFHEWEADLKPWLQKGENVIRIHFTSPREFLLEKDKQRHLSSWNIFQPDFWGRGHLRKMACAFGWDWGPIAPTAGIWKPIEVLFFESRISEWRHQQIHHQGEVELVVSGVVEGGRPASTVTLLLSREGKVVTEAVVPLREGKFSFNALIQNPDLWWPNGLGGQPLYDLTLRLTAGETLLDAASGRLGFRDLKLIREADDFGESFRFSVNGLSFFSQGANWIPCDVFPSRISEQTYRHLLQSARASHFNMIRVWGGGIYETDLFYDLCDEYGILIWQDFMFACGAYPGDDSDFLLKVEKEARLAVRRIRHHPCLALWCGNNEIEQGFVSDYSSNQWGEDFMSGQAYRNLFDDLLSRVSAEEDPATPYWPSSPHTPHGDRVDYNNERCGDAHAWSVWFGGEKLEAQRKWNYRFMSEFGFQSYPEIKTIEGFTDPTDRDLNSWVMDFHQRSFMGNKTIFSYILDWFLYPRSLEDTLWLSQIVQGLCVQYAAEHARRIQGRMDGLLYWQLNDNWPGVTWSSIDVHGRWKSLQYMAKRFFEPFHVSLLESRENSTMEIHLSNLTSESLEGKVHWELTDTAGKVIREGEVEGLVSAQANSRLGVIDLSDLREGSEELSLAINRISEPRPRAVDRGLLFWAWAESDKGHASSSLGWFTKPKYWDLVDPQLALWSRPIGADQWEITVSCKAISPWTHLEFEGEGIFSDNDFHLHPGKPVIIALKILNPVSGDKQRELNGLRVLSLYHRRNSSIT